MCNTVIAAGVWDLLHIGHINLIRRCRRLAGAGGRVVILVNSDEFTFFYKQTRPVEPEMTRLAKVRALGLADICCILPQHEDQADFLERFAPCLVVHDCSWNGEALAKQFGVSLEWMRKREIDFVYVDRTPGISSTALRAELSSRGDSHDQ